MNTKYPAKKRTRAVCYCSTVLHDKICADAATEGRSVSKQLIHLISTGLRTGYPVAQRETPEYLGQVLDGDRSAVWFYPEAALLPEITNFTRTWKLRSDSEAIRVLVYTALYAHTIQE